MCTVLQLCDDDVVNKLLSSVPFLVVMIEKWAVVNLHADNTGSTPVLSLLSTLISPFCSRHIERVRLRSSVCIPAPAVTSRSRWCRRSAGVQLERAFTNPPPTITLTLKPRPSQFGLSSPAHHQPDSQALSTTSLSLTNSKLSSFCFTSNILTFATKPLEERGDEKICFLRNDPLQWPFQQFNHDAVVAVAKEAE